MLITKSFIVINNPKTGSSFVRKVLKEIYRQRKEKYSWLKKKSLDWGLIQADLIEHFVYTDAHKKHLNQHGAVEQIPNKFINGRHIVSVIRNPYTKILSQYEFKWWKNNYHLYYDEAVIKDAFPHFPSLNLDEFIDFQVLGVHSFHPHLKCLNIGHQTVRFIEMFFNKPQATIANLNDDYIFSGAYQQDLKPITFLRQESLTEELINFLSQYDFTPQELEVIKSHGKVNITQNKHPNRMELHTPKSLDHIRTYERLLFKIYEDLGLVYEMPKR